MPPRPPRLVPALALVRMAPEFRLEQPPPRPPLPTKSPGDHSVR